MPYLALVFGGVIPFVGARAQAQSDTTDKFIAGSTIVIVNCYFQDSLFQLILRNFLIGKLVIKSGVQGSFDDWCLVLCFSFLVW